jgi:hypothetical protein
VLPDSSPLVTEQTLQAPPPIRHPVAAEPGSDWRRPAAQTVYRYRWPLGAVGLLLLSTLIVLWARARPGYDPYGWLVWGHLTVHLKLDTNGAPSWKPLPFLFTVPFALVGHYALWLWMITSVAISLSGVVFAWKVAFRLVDAAPERRYAAYAAGLCAGVALLGISDYGHSILSAESDTMIVSLCLAAVDCQLCGRFRWAFWLWVLAALGRPEAWPFLGLYSLWAWRQRPEMRHQIVAGIVAIPVLWFGIPALTSKSPFSAASLAERSPRELHGNKIFGTFGRFLDLNAASIKIAALIATGLAVLRRDRTVLILAAGVALWVLVEAAFALHGWPAVPRYMYEAAAGACVLAGVFVGRVIHDGPSVVARVIPRASPALGGWATVFVLVVFTGSLLPAARARVRFERSDLTAQRARTHEIDLLSGLVARLTPARILACGQPNIPIAFQSILAWYLGSNVGQLYFSAKAERLHPRPIVNMYPHSYGWQVFSSHTQNATQAARCIGLALQT